MDPSGTGVDRCTRGSGTAGEQESTGRSSVVHSAAHVVPDLGTELPLVDQNGAVEVVKRDRSRCVCLLYGGVIEVQPVVRAAATGRGLADPFGSLESDRG